MTLATRRARLVLCAATWLLAASSPLACDDGGSSDPADTATDSSAPDGTADTSAPDTSAPDTNDPDTATPDTMPDVIAPTCDDGVRNGGETGVDCGGATCEACADGQGCLAGADCTSGFCHPDDGVCATPGCGDGVIQAGETCDDAGESAACNDDCTTASCGDSKINATAGETCDAGGETAACDVDCTAAECGDGRTNAAAGEQCDDANALDSDACVSCSAAFCGDGVVRTAVELCDDGNMDDTDACTSDCAPASCGDGIVEQGVEPCDDGNADETDGCLSTCVAATCGDGFVRDGIETCDEGGESASCDPDCSAPECGDGIVNTAAGESCDDGNADEVACTSACVAPSCTDNAVNGQETDLDCGGPDCGPCAIGSACQTQSDCTGGYCDLGLATCVHAISCLELHIANPAAPSGEYFINPDVNDLTAPVEVWCDMVSDGGGYTMLKVSAGAPVSAAEAETICAANNMKLFVPRSEAHRNAAQAVALDPAVGPDADIDYLYILGIYPDFSGASCAFVPFNSASCPSWSTLDDSPWFVSARGDISEPNGDNAPGASMYYQWQLSGDVVWYNDIPAPGYVAAKFICDTGDKWP